MSIYFLAVWQHNKRLLGLFNTNVKILGTNIFQFNFKILNTNKYFSKGVTFPLTFVAYPTVRNLQKDHNTCSIYCFTIRYRFEFSLAPVNFWKPSRSINQSNSKRQLMTFAKIYPNVSKLYKALGIIKRFFQRPSTTHCGVHIHNNVQKLCLSL